MEIIKLKVRSRTGTGKSYTRKIRSKGWIPAIYYGKDQEAAPLEVDAREFAALVRNGKTNRLIELAINDTSEPSTTIIKEIQRHVLKDSLFFHVDFQHVAMDKKITVQASIHLVGIPVGVKEDGGILGQQLRYLTVECFPKDIPDFIEVDVSSLRIGNSVHVRDITVSDIVIKDSPEEVVAVVVHAQAVVEEKQKAAAEAAEAAAAETAEASEGEKTEDSKDK